MTRRRPTGLRIASAPPSGPESGPDPGGPGLAAPASVSALLGGGRRRGRPRLGCSDAACPSQRARGTGVAGSASPLRGLAAAGCGESPATALRASRVRAPALRDAASAAAPGDLSRAACRPIDPCPQEFTTGTRVRQGPRRRRAVARGKGRRRGQRAARPARPCAQSAACLRLHPQKRGLGRGLPSRGRTRKSRGASGSSRAGGAAVSHQGAEPSRWGRGPRPWAPAARASGRAFGPGPDPAVPFGTADAAGFSVWAG